ncbi:MAG: rod shape-determining protein [Desulfobacterales bacterium]|nr:rod shape-determining protein [Desulfobacterales bacterium]
MPTENEVEKEGILFVGIDLGTSRSAVSTSRGNRKWIESYVGWPKDFVAKKLLGERILFGQEALAHRLSLLLCRPLEHGVIREGTEKDEESVMELIGHLIRLAEPKSGDRIYTAVGVPAEALRVNKNAIRKAVTNYSEKLIVVSEPFAVAYGLNALDNAMVIDIGAGTVDFCIMHGAVPTEEEQKSLLSAGDSVDQKLFDLLSEKYPDANFTLTMVRRYKENFAFVGNIQKKAEVEIPVQGKMVVHDISKEIKAACESIVPAMAEMAMGMIARFDPEFQAKVRSNIIVAGGGSQTEGIKDYLKAAMSELAPCKFTCVDEPLYCGSDGALALAQEMPEDYWAKL